jgi:hypothetical protein
MGKVGKLYIVLDCMTILRGIIFDETWHALSGILFQGAFFQC